MDYLNKLPKIEFILTLVCFIIIPCIPQVGVIGAFILVIAYIRRSKNRPLLLRSIGFSSPANWLKVVGVSVVLGVAAELFAEIIFNPLIEKITDTPIDLTKVDFHTNLLIYMGWVALGFIVGGLLEEVLFRGFLLTRVSKLFSSTTTGNLCGLIATSTIFGLCHLYQGWSGVVSTGFIGLILGGILLAKNNLWYSILTHGFINLTGLTILYLNYYSTISTLVF
ncbi:CPBP family intramembrane glutamic endopeptidase [Hymenobacter norwichensis]|uniref:CPBP family intramembrane glutamic endopeptidase n=1 Tax=Hymenobacter norwichensis TaxID=223903 RepID=UPI0003B513DB|nr:CPBP family intramembrane glutamic endopeptidase [Hymenobacter norwichensis]